MAYAFGTGSCGWGGASATSTTIATDAAGHITVAVGDMIFAWFIVDGLSHTFTVTDNFSNTYTLVGSVINETSSVSSAALYICRNSNSAGSCSVTVTINSTAINRSLIIGSINGLSTSAAIAQNTALVTMAAGTDAVSTASATPSAQPAIVLGFQWNMYSYATAPGTGFTAAPAGTSGNPGAFFGGAYVCVEHKRVTSTAATPATFTITTPTSNGCTLAELIIPETGGGGATHKPPLWSQLTLTRGGR